MLLKDGILILGYTGEIVTYQDLEPFIDPTGNLRWELAEEGQAFVDTDGVTYYLRERAPQPALTLWLNLVLSGGDGKTPIGCKLDGSNPVQIAASLEDAAGNIIPYDWQGRILLYDSDGKPLDCLRCELSQGTAQLAFMPYGAAVPHFIASKDFDRIALPNVGTVQVLVKNEPIEIRVYR